MKSLPYCYLDHTRHGKPYWCVRVRNGKRVRINETPGTREFLAAYRAALAGEPPAAKSASGKGTMAWLIGEYMASPQWAATASETRRQFSYQFSKIRDRSGARDVKTIRQKHVVEGRDKRAAAPSDANKYVKAVRRLFVFAVERGIVTVNPAVGVKLLALPNARDGFHTWTSEEILRFERHWPLGTRQRLALDIVLYSGLRRSDVVRLGPQHVADGVITIRPQKTLRSSGVTVTLPVLPPLAQSIAACPTGALAFLTTKRGRPFEVATFGIWFKKACRAASVPGSAHGLRKAAASLAAERGATEAQLNAIFGWTEGSGESATYTRKANRAKLARDAAPVLFLPHRPEGVEIPISNILKTGGKKS